MRREYKIGKTEVGYVHHGGTKGATPYWYPYAKRDIGNVRIESHFWNDGFPETEEIAKQMCKEMAQALNSIKV